jgi:mono/diheme cytochrome c family protein
VKRFVLLAVGTAFMSVALAGSVNHREDQAPGTKAQVERGKQLFAACGGCHGAEGEGRVAMAPRLNSDSYLAVVGNEFLTQTIREGRAGTNMIPWGKAQTPEDTAAVVAFIRNWQASDGVELDQSELKGDLAVGERVYRDICSRCHGRSGAGYLEAGSGTGIGRKAFLDQASNGMLRAIVAKGKDNTAMRPFDAKSPVAVANLTPEEIDSVIAYLRKNAW